MELYENAATHSHFDAIPGGHFDAVWFLATIRFIYIHIM